MYMYSYVYGRSMIGESKHYSTTVGLHHSLNNKIVFDRHSRIISLDNVRVTNSSIIIIIILFIIIIIIIRPHCLHCTDTALLQM